MKIAIANPRSHLITFDIIDVKPERFISGDTLDVTLIPKNILRKGTIAFDESCPTPSPAAIIIEEYEAELTAFPEVDIITAIIGT